MPFCGTDSGHIRHVKPSDARRGVNKGYMAIYAEDFLYKVYPGDDIRTQSAYRAIAQYFHDEMQARQDAYQAEQAHWQAQRAHQQQVEARAQRELSQRTTQHLQAILAMRGLDPTIPIHALWLPRPAKHPRTVAHGWGSEIVSAKPQ